MSHSLFISDLHLCADQPRSMQLFERFIAGPAAQAEALYILGDLFEYWAGDDDLDDPFHQAICSALRDLGKRGTRIYIMHGNRDFLMDEELGSACDATLLDDPTLLDLYGTPTLLSHGDTLCTGDTEYQQFRRMVRDERWQAQFLAQPLAQRKALIAQMREQSKSGKQEKAMEIMDVSDAAVDELLRHYHYPRLIHGHTHRPARHLHRPDGHVCERWVLGDWDAGRACILRCDAGGVTQIVLE
jgi:UDP-2,3-diacylglucosamine hydrolase